MFIDIKIPYTTRPSMIRNTGSVYNSNPDKAYIDQKKLELKKYSTDLYAITDESINLNLVGATCEHFNLPSVDNIVDLALYFEEDIAILHKGILSAICFCFPSSWVPASRIGKSLAEIHQPVADSQYLVAASTKLTNTMAACSLGSFKRQVWTITTNSALSNHPAVFVDHADSIENLYFRLETQTTEPLGDDLTSIFFVKVDVIPLVDIWQEYGRKIVDSINTMSENVLKYKKLTQIKSLLNNI